MQKGAGWIQLAPFAFVVDGCRVDRGSDHRSMTILVIACRSPWRSTA